MFNTVRKKLSRLKNRFFSGIFYLIGLLLVLTCIAILGYQGFMYLYQGGWMPLSLRYFLSYTPYEFYAWVLTPESWIGLHKLVSWTLNVPLSLFSFLTGYLFIKLSDFIALFSDDR